MSSFLCEFSVFLYFHIVEGKIKHSLLYFKSFINSKAGSGSGYVCLKKMKEDTHTQTKIKRNMAMCLHEYGILLAKCSQHHPPDSEEGQ